MALGILRKFAEEQGFSLNDIQIRQFEQFRTMLIIMLAGDTGSVLRKLS